MASDLLIFLDSIDHSVRIFYLCFCSFHVYDSRYNVNIKIIVCQIIGPAAAGSDGPVPTPLHDVHFCVEG